jgi:hypothetical protein
MKLGINNPTHVRNSSFRRSAFRALMRPFSHAIAKSRHRHFVNLRFYKVKSNCAGFFDSLPYYQPLNAEYPVILALPQRLHSRADLSEITYSSYKAFCPSCFLRRQRPGPLLRTSDNMLLRWQGYSRLAEPPSGFNDPAR